MLCFLPIENYSTNFKVWCDVRCVCVTISQEASKPTVATKPYPAQKTLYVEVAQNTAKKTASSEPRPVSQYPEDAPSSSSSKRSDSHAVSYLTERYPTQNASVFEIRSQ